MGKPCKRKRGDPLSTGPRSSYAVGCRVGTTANGAGAALMALFLRGVFRTPPACRAIPVLPQCSVGPTPTRNPDATRALGLIYLRDGPRGIKA